MMTRKLDAQLRASAKRGHATQTIMAHYLIEGEHLTMLQIAAKLGVSKDTANKRMAAARKVPGKITWERLA